MATATSRRGSKGAKGVTKRSRTRRAGESAFGLLLVVRNVVVCVIALFVLVAGVWTSWGTAQYAMFTKGRELGTVTLERCGENGCTGRFTPASGGPQPERREVTLDKAVRQGKGDVLMVAMKPGTDEAVRTGPSGILHAWVPFGGSLILAAVVLAGGMRMRRTALVLGLLGVGLLGASFATL